MSEKNIVKETAGFAIYDTMQYIKAITTKFLKNSISLSIINIYSKWEVHYATDNECFDRTIYFRN